MNSIFSKIFEKIRPKLHSSKPTVVFPHPDSLRLCSPFRVVIEKLRLDNDFIHSLSSDDFDGVDLTLEYSKLLEYSSDKGRICYIFVNEYPVLIDYFDETQWRHSAVIRLFNMGKKCGLKRDSLIKSVIKFQYSSGEYNDLPFSVYPFIYPGLNDFKTVDGSKCCLTQIASARKQFNDCVDDDSFKHSIFARWNNFPQRQKIANACKNIPNSLISHKGVKFKQYIQEMSCSKFALAAKGNGKWSHRELEICSIGIPMMRCFRGGEQFWKPFKPDYHYISVNSKNIVKKFEYYNSHYDEALEIGNNGHEYYDSHHSQIGMQKTFKELVDEIIKK